MQDQDATAWWQERRGLGPLTAAAFLGPAGLIFVILLSTHRRFGSFWESWTLMLLSNAVLFLWCYAYPHAFWVLCCRRGVGVALMFALIALSLAGMYLLITTTAQQDHARSYVFAALSAMILFAGLILFGLRGRSLCAQIRRDD